MPRCEYSNYYVTLLPCNQFQDFKGVADLSWGGGWPPLRTATACVKGVPVYNVCRRLYYIRCALMMKSRSGNAGGISHGKGYLGLFNYVSPRQRFNLLTTISLSISSKYGVRRTSCRIIVCAMHSHRAVKTAGR